MKTRDVAASRLLVTGVVQGVGFRPFVQRLATRHGLDGWVRNESGGVAIHVEGPAKCLTTFVCDLRSLAPPLTRIDSLNAASVPATGVGGFEIRVSVADHTQRLPISPDVALCSDCERELFDPNDRRYRYPFITCTNCGPRFTVIDAMPYDRALTSMRAFTPCADCLAEYHDPGSRRYHCESNSCPTCGPALWLETPDGPRSIEPAAAIAESARLLLEGLVLAIRGLGGFHLSVDAGNDQAVRRLRRRKHRDAKPLAVMVGTVADAERLGHVGVEERRLLSSGERPIVLLRRRRDAPLAAAVAPGLETIGVVVANTPLHRLLLAAVGCPLVMTSGNLSDEPIATANEDAKTRLAGIADAWLLHDRDIVSRYDDSVVRPTRHGPIMIRRARGYAPLPLTLPIPTTRALLAVGPHLKNTFTLASGPHAYVSQHIGDLEALATLDSFQDTLDAYRRLFHVDPEIVVADRHPEYLSTRVARDMNLPTMFSVQHHHAHLAAVAAEHGVVEPVIGVIYDGTGYGDDGHVWGGEVLIGNLISYRRAAQLRYVGLPGGDLASRQLWRIIAGWCHEDPTAAATLAAVLDHIPPAQRDLALQQLRIGLNTPKASSMGRLFDAAAAILGVRDLARYEGQAAMELESAAGRHRGEPLPYDIRPGDGGCLVLDPLPLLVALAERRALGVEVETLAA
jgi:hydrogenase maturation protein HypF